MGRVLELGHSRRTLPEPGGLVSLELEMVVKAQEELRVERDRAKLKPGKGRAQSQPGATRVLALQL